MKTIIKSLIIVGLLVFAQESFSQKKKKITKTTLKVDGVCLGCKNRIENALDIPGVKYAKWDVDTKILTIAYRNNKYSRKDISQIIANVGHDTEEVKAPDEVYNKLKKCCKYREPAVVDSPKL